MNANNILNFINNNDADNESIDIFVQILSLPDEEFNEFAPVFINSLEQELKDPAKVIMVQQLFKESGVSLEELRTKTEEYCKLFEEKYTDFFGKNKVDFLKKILIIFTNSLQANGYLGYKTIDIPIEICNSDAKIPTYARIGDAGLDVYSTEEITLGPGEKHLFKLGIKVQIPKGYELEVVPKSGISLKTGLKISNSPGTIDSGYRDEVGVIIENSEPCIKDITYDFVDNKPVITSILHGKSYTIEKGQKIAQLVLKEVPIANFKLVNKVDDTIDRGGGFGSTGIK